MLAVGIIASGSEYRAAASWAAATYRRHLPSSARVTVWLPNTEPPGIPLSARSRAFGFTLRHFPFQPVGETKFTSQLKCQGFAVAVAELPPEDLLFLVDADTCCQKPLTVPTFLAQAIRAGRIGLAPDIADHHFPNPDSPWYLPPDGRLPYVNSGVILAARGSLDLFREFRDLSAHPLFLHGPFNDQKVINYSLGHSHRDRLVVLDPIYNGIHRTPETIIAHCAGGAGWLGPHQRWRKVMHRGMCSAVLTPARRTTARL